MIDMSMNVYKTGLVKKECKGTLLDGEYVTQGKHVGGKSKSVQKFLIFDIYYFQGKSISKEPFAGGRYNAMQQWMQQWNNDGGPLKQYKSITLQVSLKNFFIAKGDDIFEKASQILSNDSTRDYNVDGLIFTSNLSPLPERAGETFYEQFKWKPAKDNTIDFLVMIEKDTETKEDIILDGIKPGTETDIRYKTLRLLVSSRDPPNSREIILNEQPLEKARSAKPRAVVFTPIDYPDLQANMCYVETMIDNETSEEFVKTEADEPIYDKTIVEMRYDTTRLPGWRWIPMRIRVDKTERFIKGMRTGDIRNTMNSKLVADDVWNSIHDPVTEHMICTGDEAPTSKELDSMAVVPSKIQKQYREKGVNLKDDTQVRGMLNFHNKYIKMDILYGAVFAKGRSKKIIDMAVGEASDLHKWVEKGADFVLGVDLAGDSILNEDKGAYKRLLQRYERNRNDRNPKPIPPIFFVIGNSSQPIYNGTAGGTDQEKDILRTIFGYPTEGAVPRLVANKGAGELRNGADSIVCMYALHYFFETEETFNGFFDNIDKTLKVGGLFVGTNFDGEAVFNLLRNTNEGDTISGVEKDSTLWEIQKLYTAEELPYDADYWKSKMAVNVKFITIGMSHIEYLVPWQLLVNKMKSIGCELVQGKDLEELGLKHSTNMYGNSYEMVNKKDLYKINNKAAKDFSFLNRWYIFKRISKSGIQPEEVTITEELRSVSAAVEASEPVSDFMKSIVKPDETAVVPGSLSPGVVASDILQQRKFKPNEVYSFKEDSIPIDSKLKLPEKYTKYAARWMAPNAPFPIMDLTDNTDKNIYPSITHFLIAMKFKYASNKLDKVKEFSNEGTIHQSFIRARLSERVSKGVLSDDVHYDLLDKELKTIEKESRTELRKANTGFNESKWATVKDDLLRSAIQQRLKDDKWFCIIVNAVIVQNKYLLYFDTETSEMGGVRKADGTIKGENKYGKYILELATRSPEILKACAETGKEPTV
jgi:mRNA (guanine-N7-)-methyltransferase